MTVLLEHPQATPATRRSSTALIAALVLTTGIVTIDNTVLNVALPSISRDLHAGTSQLQWVVNAYSLLFGGLLLTGGTTADRLGRRRVMLCGVVAFGLASAVVLAVHGAGELIALRALVGAAAAFIMPSTLSILMTEFTGAERAKAVGLWSAVTAAGFAAGPIVGGALLSAFSWRAVFLVNVPLAALALVAGLRWVPESRSRRAGRPDVAGSLLSTATMLTLVYGIVNGPVDGWTSLHVLGSFVGCFLLAALFVLRELTARAPMLDVRRVASRAFAAPALAELALMFSIAGPMFLITQQLQLVDGHAPVLAGLMVAPAAGGVLLATPFVSRRAGSLTARRGATFGLLLVAAGLALIAVTLTHGYAGIAAGLVVIGVGVRFSMTPVALSVVDALPREDAGMGSALNHTFQEVGGALGVALLGAVFNAAYRGDLPAAVPGVARSSVAAALQIPGLGGLARSAFQSGFTAAAWVCAGFVLVVAAVGSRVLPNRVLAEDD